MVDLRVKPSVTPERATSDNKFLSARSTRDGALFVANWTTALAMEGRLFMLQVGNEDAPVDATVTIDDELAMALVEVPAGTTAIPAYGQRVIATWSDAATINYLISVRSIAGYTSGGSAFTPLNMRTDNPITSTSTAYVGTDVVPTAKTAGTELEVYRESVELNLGNAADYWPKIEYKPLRDACIPPIVVGAGCIINYFGGANGGTDMTVYMNLQWFEIPSTMVTG